MAFFVVAGAWGMGWLEPWLLFAAIGPGLLILLVGVYDDFHGLAPTVRLASHFLAAGMALFTVVYSSDVTGPTGWSGMRLIDLLWLPCLVFWVWFINLFNFMDGIDGLAATQALMLFTGMALNFWFCGALEWAWISLFMAGSVVGFVFFNWPPAKIFMGDGGSGFLGFIIGYVAILSSVQTGLPVWSWLIMAALFLADSTTTLLVRFCSGANVTQAHRSHAYQILARRYESHLRVTLGYGGVMLVVLAPLSWLSAVYPAYGPWLFVSVLLVLMLCVYRVGCGRGEVGCGRRE